MGFERVAIQVTASYFSLALETAGNLLLFSQIFYERYGMNPQKRWITNQLYSGLCICTIAYNILVYPVVYLHFILEYDVGADKWMYNGSVAYVMFVLLSLAQMTTIRALYMYAYPVMAELDESIVTWVLQGLSCIIVFIIFIVRWNTEADFSIAGYQDPIRFYTTWLPGLICLAVIIGGFIAIYAKKYNTIEPVNIDLNQLEQAQGHQPNAVNEEQVEQEPQEEQGSATENMITTIGVVALTAFIILLIPLFAFHQSYESYNISFVKGILCIAYCIIVMGGCLIHLATKPNQIRYVLNELM